jgi:protein-disulfide isomerase
MIVLLIVHALLAQELETNPTAPDVPPGFGKLDIPMIAVLPVLVGIGLVTMGMSMKKAAGGGLTINSPTDFSKVVLIPEKANWFGEKTAPLTIVEFADILCPSCQQTSPAVKEFVAQNKGKASLVYRHYPLVQIHPQANAAAAIAEAAADQGKFWDFVLAVMGKQMKPESPDELFEVAQGVGIDTATIRKRLSDTNDVVYERIDRDLKAVKALGINSTPTFLLVANGKVIETAGPGDILPKLNGEKAQAAMNAMPAASSSSATPETKP